MSAPDNDDLSEKLQCWRIDEVAPVDFQRHVWTRIAARQARKRDWSAFGSWLGQFFSRPAVAFAVVILSFVAGAEVAREKAVAAHEQTWKLMEDRYASLINPAARHVAHVNHLD